MNTSLAHIRPRLQGVALAGVLALVGCASTPPPTDELAAAQASVARAADADADQYAPADIDQARVTLRHAQVAMANARGDEARVLALSASALADLAQVRARQAATATELSARRAEITSLRQRLQAED